MLTPHLSSYWIHMVTPVPAAIARPLAEGLSNPVICRENRITSLIPQELFDARKAIVITSYSIHYTKLYDYDFDSHTNTSMVYAATSGCLS